MHFLREALYKKPLEPRYLVWFRGGTAITMGCLFLAFCGFLISQIHNDRPLIVNSSEQITTYTDSPDIEMCIQNSTFSVIKCSAMYYNWTVVDVEDCWTRFFRAGANTDATKCWVFETNGSYRMATGLTYDSRDALRRLDFYWNIDSLLNISYATASIPAIAVQLYDPHFSSWKYNTVGKSQVEQETITNIQLGETRATTMQNVSTSIFYSPQKYRAIKPHDAAAIIGFTPNYININTLPNFQQDWPLQPNPPSTIFNKSLYQGQFSVQLAKSTIDVKTEVRQHSLLASVALAGGCYGVLSTIYILLFGMTRMTPWGLVHHIPVYISKKKHSDKYIEDGEFMSHEQQGLTAHQNTVSNSNNKNNQFTRMIPWFFRQPLNGQKTFTPNGQNDSFFRRVITPLNKSEEDLKIQMEKVLSVQQPALTTQDSRSTSELQLLNLPTGFYQPNLSDMSSPTPHQYTPSPPQLPQHDITPLNPPSNNQDLFMLLSLEKRRSDKLEERSNELSIRVKELETILSEYFIDTAYIDSLRHRKKSFFIEGGSEDGDNTIASSKNVE